MASDPCDHGEEAAVMATIAGAARARQRELLAAHLTGSKLPHYAPAFAVDRYEDPEYQELLETWGASGQL